MTSNTTMTAAVYRRFGAPNVVRLEQRPIPSPERGEVLVRVHASTVSVADHRARARDIPVGLGMLAAVGLGVFRPRRPILGADAAGVVDCTRQDFAAGGDTYDDRSFDLADVVEAHRYVDIGRKRGNVVLRVTHAEPDITHDHRRGDRRTEPHHDKGVPDENTSTHHHDTGRSADTGQSQARCRVDELHVPVRLRGHSRLLQARHGR